MSALQEIGAWLKRYGRRQREEEKKQTLEEIAFFSGLTRRSLFKQPEINREAGKVIELLRKRLQELQDEGPKARGEIKDEYERVMK